MTGAPDKSTAAASFARRYQVSLASQFKVMLFGAHGSKVCHEARARHWGRSHTDSQVKSNQVKSSQVKASIWLSQVKASNCMRLDLTLSLVRNPDLASPG